MGSPKEIDVDAELARFEAEERARLGMAAEPVREQWTDEMINPQFKASQRAHTTILVSGLTMAHDFFVQGALSGLGYNVRMLDCPDNDALRYGKEFGNRAQCNPTYFTVGNLVKELCRIRDEEGKTSQEIVDNYLFLTAGACGPCRFGMYVTEYRKALRDAGFDGFRVMLFQQSGGFEQATGEEEGLKLDPPFFIALAKCVLAGDVLNAVAYRISPYEVVPGATERAKEQAKQVVHEALCNRTSVLRALLRAREIFSRVEVDRTQAKPKVSIIGEFWAMTTEGDGNYELQKFLESEGAEVDVQLITAWVLYLLWEGKNDTEERAGLKGTDGGYYGLEGSDVGVKMATLWLSELLIRGLFYTFAWAVGLKDYHLPNMDEITEVAHRYYDKSLRGGEGHMEVAKLILNVVHTKCHMTISVKPFGCMPSSGVSDGVQSLITELHPDAIFCAVETSGDGAVNFYSRVQMFLFKARLRAVQEMDDLLAAHGITREQAQAFLARHPRYANALYKPPHVAMGNGADLVAEIAPLVTAGGRLGRARVQARRAVERTRTLLGQTLPKHGRYFGQVVPYLPALVRKAATQAHYLGPSLRDTFEELTAKIWKPSDESLASLERVERGRIEEPTPELVRLGGLQPRA